MSDEERYRRHAKFCREQASLLLGAERERQIHLADEYERLARVAAGMSAGPIPPAPILQQPMQQQQAKKTEPEDEEQAALVSVVVISCAFVDTKPPWEPPCEKCGKPMRLVGIEADDTRPNMSLHIATFRACWR